MNTTPNNLKLTLPLAALSLVAVISIAHAEGDWVRQSPVPYAFSEMQTFESVAFFTPDRGFISGSQSFLLETNDGGETWSRHDIPSSFDLSKLFFFDDIHGWIIGSGGDGFTGNYRTINGGQTWQPMTDLIGTFDQIEFLTPTFGWTQSNGSAAATTDGGQSWNYFFLTDPPVWNDAIAEVHFANEQLGLGVHFDNTELYRTTNGGQTWNVVATGGDLRQPLFLTESVALVTNLLGQLQRSTDGGQTWSDVKGPAFGFEELLAFTDQVAIAWNTSSVIRTVDGGVNWQPVDFPFTFIWDVQQLDDTTAVIQLHPLVFAVPWAVIVTTDAGATWNSAFTSATNTLDFVLSDGMTGYGVGASGQILKTTDGGSSWDYHSSGLNRDLEDIHMIDEHRGVAVGESILYTEDGEKWIPAEIHGPGSTLRAVTHFGDTFYAVGEFALFQKSTDGGRTWSSENLFGGFWDNLWDIQFISENEAWSVAVPARIIHTTDGGENWDLQFADNGFGLSCVHFIDDQRGWVGGPSDAIMRTTDGGLSWTVHNIPNPPNGPDSKWDIHFVDENLGYLVGNFGYVAKTLDGGLNWFNVDLPVADHISEMYVLSADELIISCFNGTIYRTQNGGKTWQQIVTGFENEDVFVSFYGLARTPSGRLYVAGDRGHLFAQSAPQILGDLDGDGVVGVKDLLILLGDWGPCPPKEDCPADLDGDGSVGVKDLLILLGNWG